MVAGVPGLGSAETATPVGVLALQGDYAAHLAVLESCGVRAAEVRNFEELESVEALIIPGGESTTMLKLIDRNDLRDPLSKRIAGGMAVFGTCAGAILLADEVSDGEAPLGGIPLMIRRNAYGPQVQSFEAGIQVPALGSEVLGVFIRAPVIESAGEEVHVLARWADSPVLVRHGNLLAATFHPELAGDRRLHQYFIEEMAGQAA